MADVDRKGIWKQQMEADGPSAEFVITRSIRTQVTQGLGKGPSEEVLDRVFAEMTIWVGTRMSKYHEATGLMPQNVRVEVHVYCEA